LSTEQKPASLLQRLRFRWYRVAFWSFLVLGSLGAATEVVGLILSLLGGNSEDFGPWWVQVIFIAFCGLFVALGLKGLKIRSIAELEAEHDLSETRIGKFLSRLSRPSSGK
jgi:hypothetical protein